MNVTEIVTNKIMSMLEKGDVPWEQPWYGKCGCYSGITGKGYSFLNQCLLAIPGDYFTFKQITDLGGKVKKGAKSSMIVFWNITEKKTGKKDDNGEDEVKSYPVLKYYNVFHISQTEGIESKITPTFFNDLSDYDEVEDMIFGYTDKMGISFKSERNFQPSYNKRIKEISVPDISQFSSEEMYYSEVFNLLGESAISELNLDVDPKKDKAIRVLTSAALSNIFGIETEKTDANNSHFIESLKEEMREDKNFIISVLGKAEKCVNYIMGV